MTRVCFVHKFGELDHSGCEFFTRYISNPTPLLYLFHRLYDIFVSVSWLSKIPLCCVGGVFQVISDFIYSLNTLVVLLVRYGWQILRVVLVSSCLIVNPEKFSISPIDWFVYSFSVHSITFINYGLSPIARVSSTYMNTITVPSSFFLYKRQQPVLHCLNPDLRVIVVVYSLNQKRYDCTRP